MLRDVGLGFIQSARSSFEVPRPDLDGVDMEVAHVDVAGSETLRRHTAGIGRRRAVMELVAAPVR